MGPSGAKRAALYCSHVARASVVGTLRLFGRILFAMGLARFVIGFRKHTPRILVYHSCGLRERGLTDDLGCYLPPERLRLHLEVVARYYNSATVASLEAGDLPDRAMILTFDDGHRSIYDEALPSLRRHGLVATVYLVTASVGNRTLMWPHELCWFMQRFRGSALATIAARYPMVPRGTPPYDVINYLCAVGTAPVIDAILNELRAAHGVDPESLAEGAGLYLSWQQVQALAEAGVEFGCHTHTHPDCARLTLAEFRTEVMRSRDEIRAHLPAVTSFAFPFGSWSTQTMDELPTLGFSSALLLGEANRRSAELLVLPRFGTEAGTAAEFFADVEIVAPLLDLLRSLRARFRSGRPASIPEV